MIEIPGSYQAVFFGPVEDIIPSPDTINFFLQILGERGFLPSTFQELTPTSPVKFRLRMSTPRNDWELAIGSDRMVLNRRAIQPVSPNLGTIEDFTHDAVDIFTHILLKYRKKAYRLSLISEGLVRELPDEKLQEIAKKFLQPPEYYQNNLPIEWNIRLVTRIPTTIHDQAEQLNVITQIERVHGAMAQPYGLVPFDRIHLAFDVNTFQDRTDQRFDELSIADFFTKAIDIRKQLLAELEAQINA